MTDTRDATAVASGLNQTSDQRVDVSMKLLSRGLRKYVRWMARVCAQLLSSKPTALLVPVSRGVLIHIII
jgi:hypothetical protein